MTSTRPAVLAGMLLLLAAAVRANYQMPDLEWTEEYDGTYSGNLVFGLCDFEDDLWGNVTTYLFDCMLPAPSLVFMKCYTYYLTVHNNLELPTVEYNGGDSSAGPATVLESYYVGLHVQGLYNDNDESFVTIAPGESYTYTFSIPCDHAGGTILYYAYNPGSITLQFGGGAMGAGAITDSDGDFDDPEAADTYFNEAAQQLMVLSFLDVDFLSSVSDSLFEADVSSVSHWLLNGETVPPIGIHRLAWERWRFINASPLQSAVIEMTDCEMQLIAKDGVYLAVFPREVSKVFLPPTGRADVMVRCNTSADDESLTENPASTTGRLIVNDQVVAYPFSVTEDDTVETLEVITALRPSYLLDLTDNALAASGETVQNEFDVYVTSDAINDEAYTSASTYLTTITTSSVQEWTIHNSHLHPYYQHIQPFQLLDEAAIAYKNELLGDSQYFQYGDWHQVIAFPGDLKVRFRTPCFPNMAISSADSLDEDHGAIAVVEIVAASKDNPVS